MVWSILYYNNVKFISEHEVLFSFPIKPFGRIVHGLYILTDAFVNQVYKKDVDGWIKEHYTSHPIFLSLAE